MQQKDPFINPLQTKLSKVKDIPYFVSNKFLRTYYRDRYQLSQVERLVQDAYENYLVNECTTQKKYKRSLINDAKKAGNYARQEDQEKALRQAKEFELSRCLELEDLFPSRKKYN